MTTVYNSLFYSGFTEQTTQEDKTTLDKNAFLKLMITKLQNQDPLQPVDDEKMMTQMTQYSTVEQLTNINQQLSSMLKFNQFLGLSSLIGKQIEWKTDDGTINAATVTSVQTQHDQYHVLTDTGERIPAEQITVISG
ncbi:MAG: hypothetical protein H0Z33_03875 [Bacillaceae bacterium]|nr:hypothetical protein [Bacillaceae bacterium]